MRGSSCTLEGMGDGPEDYTDMGPFYVPGERHENLPVNQFAGPRISHVPKGMGTPVQTLWPDTSPPEYATGGSGMFQGERKLKMSRQMADFGYGRLVVSPGAHAPMASGYSRKRGVHGVDFTMGQAASTTASTPASSTSVLDVIQSGLTSAGQAATALAPKPAAAPAAVATSFLTQKIAGIPLIAIIAVGAIGGFFAYKKFAK
jgi:hypothetical protein